MKEKPKNWNRVDGEDFNPGSTTGKNPHAVALGSIKTEKKARSSRLNGLKGGRPKKLSTVDVDTNPTIG